MKFLFDFLPILLFFIAYKSHGIYGATAGAIAASALQVGWLWLKHRKVDRMPMITLVLLVVMGGATLVLHDEVYIKWKPTVVNWLFGVVFLGSQFIGNMTIMERMIGGSVELPRSVWVKLNMAWTVFFFTIGLVNLYVAFHFDTDTWVNFKLFGMLGLTLVFVVGQSLYMARYIKTTEPIEPKE
jgi:intracellular septation protein